ncbi:MAG: tannase/feruloyl esterase family alpha/beta hydrolase [Acidimicrobiales bacterium]
MGYVFPQVHFELRLPTETWNGRYFQTGCGGYCGSTPIGNCDDALALGFAVGANNMGAFSGAEALWGRDNEQLRIDYAHRGPHVNAVAAKAIINAFYGQPASYSYFRGCSTGGREGLIAAQRYPQDFDGIIAGHPASSSLQGAVANNWIAQVGARADGTGSGRDVIITDPTAEILRDAVMAACDGVDGLVDGLIDDPRNCDFDLEAVACSAGAADMSTCLTPEELEAAAKLYDGPRNSQGIRLCPGAVLFGSERGWAGEPPRSANFANNQLRYLQFRHSPPLTYTYEDFDFDSDFQRLREGDELYDPFDPDLSAFHARGGKLLLWNGLADVTVSALVSIDYYTEVANRMGGPAQLHDWFRLFLIPGGFHCLGGAQPARLGVGGPTTVGPEPLLQMVDWVENVNPPDQLVVSYLDAGGEVFRTRPVFPYPQVARYTGSGSIDEADNFVAAPPPVEHDGDVKWMWDPGRGMRDRWPWDPSG